MFEVLDARVWTSDGRMVVKGVTLKLKEPGIYVIMGPNGAGKSSLVNAVMGHRDYKLEGHVLLDGEDVTRLPVYEKARRGLTLALQIPVEVEGVRVSEILVRVLERFQGLRGREAVRKAKEILSIVGLPDTILGRQLMVGMSGGERKRLELARVLAQRPRVAMLDEPDSGVDVESLPLIARAIERLREEGSIVLLISHQPSLFRYLAPDSVYVMYDGRIVAEGGPELIKRIEEKGYTWLAAGR